jgi:antitoxin PrlF
MHVTTKGQITIPLELREKYGITPDTELEMVDDNGKITIKKGEKQKRKNKFGKFRGIADIKMTTDEIMALTRQ